MSTYACADGRKFVASIKVQDLTSSSQNVIWKHLKFFVGKLELVTVMSLLTNDF